jgi:KEOPS complex subunit Cgi121
MNMDTSENRDFMNFNSDCEVKYSDIEIRQVCFQVRDTDCFLSWLRELSNQYCVSIVCFNAEFMAGKEHVISAMLHAIRAMNTDSCISSSLEIEALLYAAGSRQCQDAIKFGVRQGPNTSYLCIYPKNQMVLSKLLKDMTLLSEDFEYINDEKMEVLISLFGITNEEVAVTGKDRIKELVLERVALLDVNK